MKITYKFIFAKLNYVFYQGLACSGTNRLHILNIIIQGKPVRVLKRLVGSGSMLSKNLITGSLINAIKPVGVLNRLPGNVTMLEWYQDKPVEVLNRHASSGEILGKKDLVNALLCT